VFSKLFENLDSHGAPATLKAGAMLFRNGDPVTGAFTIRKGKVVLIWATVDGITPMNTLGPGQILGLPAVVNGEYSVSARLVEDSEFGFLPASQVRELMATDRGKLQEATKLMAQEVSRMRGILKATPEPKASKTPKGSKALGRFPVREWTGYCPYN
jgi:CRP-like cAMP-binding protein